MTVKVKALNILRDARALIATPEGWTQGAGARDQNGDPVEVGAAGAICFCPVAAIFRAAGVGAEGAEGADAPEILTAVHMVALEIARVDLARDYPAHEIDDMEFGVPELVDINDLPDTTHTEILAAFDAAIARA